VYLYYGYSGSSLSRIKFLDNKNQDVSHLVASVFFGMGSHRCNKDDVHESYVRLIPLTLLMTLVI